MGPSLAPGARVLAESGEEPLADAGRALGEARAILPQLERALDSATVDLARARESERMAGDLGRRLMASETARDELRARLRENESQMGRLMTLYVATYQLHCTLDPREVQSTIVDIVLNLLGAESFVLLLRPNQTAPTRSLSPMPRRERCQPPSRARPTSAATPWSTTPWGKGR
jgi:hypothetical protein